MVALERPKRKTPSMARIPIGWAFAESAATELVGINKPIFDDCGFDELAAPAGSGMFPWLPRPVCGPTPILPPIDLMELQDPERSPYLYAVPVE